MLWVHGIDVANFNQVYKLKEKLLKNNFFDTERHDLGFPNKRTSDNGYYSEFCLEVLLKL
jgi:hypothetical protein